MSGEELYDSMGADYETMVSWDARIANETPFFRRLFEERAVRRVLDVACGVGRHAVTFASWGLTVTGADPSAALLDLARANAAEAGVDVGFVQTDFLNLTKAVEGSFDAVICIGNSLPHLLDLAQVEDALAQMRSLLEPGGTLVVQTRSAERIWARGSHLLSPTLRRIGDRDLIFLRLVDVHAPTTTLNVIRLTREGGDWNVDTKTTQLRPIAKDEMEVMLARAGFASAEYYGDYRLTPFGGADSDDLLVVATNRGVRE